MSILTRLPSIPWVANKNKITQNGKSTKAPQKQQRVVKRVVKTETVSSKPLTGMDAKRAAKQREISQKVRLSHPATGKINNPSGMKLADEVAVAEAYSKCLCEPYRFAHRVPEAGAGPTTLIRSTRNINVPMYTEAPEDGGLTRYAGVFQPKFGGLAKPLHYQSAFVDFSVGPRPDLSSAASWTHTAGTTDIALDANMKFLLNQEPFAAEFGYRLPNMPADPAPILQGADYLLQGTRPLVTDPLVMTWSSDTTANTSRLNLPAGNWTMMIQTLVNPNVTTSNPYVVSRRTSQGASTVLVPSVSIPASLTLATDHEMLKIYNFTISENEHIWFAPASAVVTRYQEVIITISSTAFPGVNDNPSYGLVEKIRPVAMSVLATNTSSTLTGAGMTGIMLTPGGYADKIYSNDASWYTLNGLTSKTTTQLHKGQFVEGSFCFWKPITIESNNWFTPAEMLEHEFPAILLVGEVPSSGGNGKPTMNVTFQIVYEIQQNSQLFEDGTLTATTTAREIALNAIALVDCASENPGHGGLFHDVGSALGGLAGSILGGIFL